MDTYGKNIYSKDILQRPQEDLLCQHGLHSIPKQKRLTDEALSHMNLQYQARLPAAILAFSVLVDFNSSCATGICSQKPETFTIQSF